MITVAPGTQTEDDLLYTAEQVAALPSLIVVPELVFNAARREFVNQLFLPDGTVSTAVDDMLANARERVTTLLATKQTDAASRQLAQNALGKVYEIEGHLEERRFLFVVDHELNPLIYFQCAVPGNPDVDFRTKADVAAEEASNG